MNRRQQLGVLCEAILREHLIRNGYFVYTPIGQQGPADLIAINSKTGKVVLFDAKTDRKRVNPGRTNPARIHRKRTALQKKMGVRLAYVDEEKRTIWITPPLD